MKAAMTTTLATVAASALLADGLALRACRPGRRRRSAGRAQQNFDAVQMQVLHVQGNVYMLVGAGGNITVQAGDAACWSWTRSSRRSATSCSPRSGRSRPSRSTTSSTPTSHDDHIGGNENLAKAGPTRPDRAPIEAGLGGNTGAQTTIIAHENVLNRMSRRPGRMPGRPAVADRHLLRRAEGAVLQRRGGADHPPARRAHRRRQHRLLPAVGRHRHRRHLHDDEVSVHRRAARRQRQRRSSTR